MTKFPQPRRLLVVATVVAATVAAVVAVDFLSDRGPAGWHAPGGDRGPRPDDRSRGDPRERVQAFRAEGAAVAAVDPASAAPADATGRSGEAIYSRFCSACHETGVSDAPKFAEEKAWAWRLKKGMDGLLETTVNGVDLMPQMGTCMDCSEEELIAAINYMIHG